VAVRLHVSGTHDGEYMGVPPTGKYLEQEAAEFARFAGDSNIVEYWAYQDNLWVMQQIGALDPVQG
jgi:predicted ester cyclase